MSLALATKEKLIGKALRKIPSETNVYLSFDDGPDSVFTPKVLEVLKRHNVQATFFVIGQKAIDQLDLIKKILSDGHSIGNHSLDHSYSVFFKGQRRMLEWIKDSESLLAKHQIPSVGFRPPVGIRTPELARALYEQKLPLILWKQRTFDKALPFTIARAKKMAQRTQSGDILLLHDVQKNKWQNDFLIALETLISELKEKEFTLAPIKK